MTLLQLLNQELYSFVAKAVEQLFLKVVGVFVVEFFETEANFHDLLGRKVFMDLFYYNQGVKLHLAHLEHFVVKLELILCIMLFQFTQNNGLKGLFLSKHIIILENFTGQLVINLRLVG